MWIAKNNVHINVKSKKVTSHFKSKKVLNAFRVVAM